MRSVFALIQVVVAAAVLLAVVAVGGRPGAFPDTAFYYSQGEFIAARLGLVDAKQAAFSATDPTSVLANAKSALPTPLDTVLAARPPAYGLLLFSMGRQGGLWALAAVQALLAAYLLHVTAKAVLGRSDLRAYAALVTLLALASSLPFVAGFAMPDLFAGLSLLAAGLLLTYPDRLSRPDQLGLAGLLCFGVACHPVTLILTGVVITLGMVLAPKAGATASGGRLAICALVGGLALSAVVTAAATAPGHPQSSPPFLTARVLADGPGRLYLRQACSRATPYALCAFRDRPLDRSEDVSWTTDSKAGVFAQADMPVRAALQREQTRFVVNAVRAHPFLELGAIASNSARQLVSFAVDDELRNDSDFFRHPFLARTRLVVLIPDMAPCRAPLSACANRLPYDWLGIIQQSVVLMSFGLIFWRFTRPDFSNALRAVPLSDLVRIGRLTGLFLVGITVNAALCGAIAGPFPRYGARLIWLIPMIGGLILLMEQRAKTTRARDAN